MPRRRNHFLTPALEPDAPALALYVAPAVMPAILHVETAFDSRARTRGLLGRDGLADDRALVIAPCWSIHTIGMRFVIDVLYVARDGRIVKIVRRLAPWRLSMAWTAFCVIELAAGIAARAGLRVGDRLRLGPRPESI